MDFQPYAHTSKLFDINYQVPEGCRLTVNQGGTSSGKTYSLLQVLGIKAYSNPNCIITVAGQDMPNLKAGSIRDLRAIIQGSEFMKYFCTNYNKSEQIFTFRNGSIIEFKAYDDEQDAKNGKRDFLFANEANGLPYEIFEALYVRTRLHSWIDYNPSAEFWLHKRKLLELPEVRFIKSTFEHNPFLEQSVIDKILSYKDKDPYRWKVYGLGEMAALEGAIFRNWSEGQFNESPPYCYGQDYGYTNDPTTLLKVAVDKKAKKVYLKECFYLAKQLGTNDIYELNKSHIDDINDVIVGDSAEHRLIDELEALGLNMELAEKGAGSVKEGITSLQDYELIVDPESYNLKAELNNYIWNNKKAGIPIDKHNHLIDPARYAFKYLTGGNDLIII